MPVVRARRQVAPTPIPGTRQTAYDTPESLGAGAARAEEGAHEASAHLLGQVASLAATEARQVYDDARRRGEQVALLETQNKVRAWETEHVDDPERGVLAVRGKDALERTRSTLADFDKFTADLEPALPRELRPTFAQWRAGRAEQMHRSLSAHALNELQTFETGEVNATIAQTRDTAIRHAGDPVRVASELADLERTIQTHGPGLGLGPAEIAAKIAAERSAVHAAVVQNLIANDQAARARAYFEATQDQIVAPVRTQLTTALQTAGQQDAGLALADRIRRGHLPDVPLGVWLDAIPNDTPAAVRQVAAAELRVRDSVRKGDERDAYENTLDRLYTTVLAGQTPNPADLAALRGRDQAGVATLRATLARRAEPETDWEVYTELFDTMQDLEAFKGANLRVYRPVLSDEHYAYFLKAQKEARDGRPETVRAAAIDTEDFNQLAEGAGLHPYAATSLEGDRRRLGQLRGAVEREIDKRQTAGKRPLTRDEKRNVMKAIIDNDVLVGWSQTRRPIAIVEPLEVPSARVPFAEIGDKTLTEFRNRVRSVSAATLRLTDAEIDRRYKDRLERAAAARLLNLSEADVLAILLGKK